MKGRRFLTNATEDGGVWWILASSVKDLDFCNDPRRHAHGPEIKEFSTSFAGAEVG